MAYDTTLPPEADGFSGADAVEAAPDGTGRLRVTACWICWLGAVLREGPVTVPVAVLPVLLDPAEPPAPGTIFSSSPIASRSALVILFATTMSMGSTPNRVAMLSTVSAGETTYVVGPATAGGAGGAGGSGPAPGRISSM